MAIVCSCTALSDRFFPDIIESQRTRIEGKSSLGAAAAFVHREARKAAGITKKGDCLKCFETVAATLQNAGLFTGVEFTPSEQKDAERCASCDGGGACGRIQQF